jgi:Leucine Rich repeat
MTALNAIPRKRRCLLFCLGDDWLISFLSDWVNVRSLVALDGAVTNNIMRLMWLNCLSSSNASILNTVIHDHASVRWLILRRVSISRLHISGTYSWQISNRTFKGATFTSLHDVYLSACRAVTDAGLTCLLKNCADIHTFDITGCDSMTNHSIDALARRCTHLQHVTLSVCCWISDCGIGALAQRCPLLQSIDLSYCSGITDVGVTALAVGCHKLQTINLSSCINLTDAGISALALGCPELRVVIVSDCSAITDECVTTLIKYCSKLESLDFSGCSRITYHATPEDSCDRDGPRLRVLRANTKKSLHPEYLDLRFSGIIIKEY